jgi:hypothetical protein
LAVLLGGACAVALAGCGEYQAPEGPPETAVLVGAGDIAVCGGSGDEATADLLDSIPGIVFTAGDNAYPDGSATNFADCYAPSWGRHRDRTRPSPGNHDYHTAGAAAYFAYFGANAGDGTGYYAYRAGGWLVLSLNSNIAADAGSPQHQWLVDQLAADTGSCVLAYWHHARFSSSSLHGSDTRMADVFSALYDAGAEVAIVGHDHTYERFARQTPDAVADPVGGVRQFVVGTGGGPLYAFGPSEANSELRYNADFGVIKLTLDPHGYAWEFVVTDGSTVDSGAETCR